MKLGNKIILILFVFISIISLQPVYGAMNEEVPASVMARAKEVNHGNDNFVILKDDSTGIYYIPYVYDSNGDYSWNWQVVLYKDTFCLVSCGWQRLGWRPYNPNTYGDVNGISMNELSSNSVVQLYRTNKTLRVVYSYYNIIARTDIESEGLTQWSVWYDTANNYSFEYPSINNSDKELSDLSCDYIYIKPRYCY